MGKREREREERRRKKGDRRKCIRKREMRKGNCVKRKKPSTGGRNEGGERLRERERERVLKSWRKNENLIFKNPSHALIHRINFKHTNTHTHTCSSSSDKSRRMFRTLDVKSCENRVCMGEG